MSPRPALIVAPDPATAARTAAARVATLIASALSARGAAHVALAGGTTPRGAYAVLAGLVRDWSDVGIWYGDERCVPPGDPDSNHAMVTASLLAHANVPEGNVHRIRGEDPPDRAAADYGELLRRLVGRGGPGTPELDVAILGLGEDGHTASLFPDSPALDVHDALCVPVVGPKPPPERVTLTMDVLRSARRVIVLAVGEGKAWAVARALSGPDRAVPASLLDPRRTEFVVDTAAAPA